MFSVVILSNNGTGRLRSAIRSVWAQWCPPEDVLVLECGETPGPGPAHWEGLARRHRQIRYVYKPGLSEPAALDLGARLAEGEVLVYLDARDELLPLALEHYARHFRGPGDHFCYGRAVLRIGGQFAPAADCLLPTGDVLGALLRQRLAIHRSAFAVRRTAFPSLSRAHGRDGVAIFELVLRLASRFAATCVQEDVAIVEQPCAPAVARLCTARCRAVRQLLQERADCSAAAAEFDYEAALAWRRTGHLRRALVHARRAAQADRGSLRYWTLFHWLRSQSAFAVPRRPLEVPHRQTAA